MYPNVWVGPAWFGFDILGPASGTTLVGSAENVAARLREYEAQGAHAFILSGFPLIQEAAPRMMTSCFRCWTLDHVVVVRALGAIEAAAPPISTLRVA